MVNEVKIKQGQNKDAIMKEKIDKKMEVLPKNETKKENPEPKKIEISKKKTEGKKNQSVVQPKKTKEQVIAELKKVYKPNESTGKKIKRKFDSGIFEK